LILNQACCDALETMVGGDVRIRSDDDGAAAVEFALVLTLLMVLLFGIIEFGYGFYQAQSASAGVREGARRAAVGQAASCAQLRGTVTGAASGITFGTVTVALTDTNADGTAGDVGDTVAVTVPYTIDLGVLGGLIPGLPSTLARTAVAQARIELQPTGGQAVSCP
jgi:Flp pilus assembly protein TadG